MPRSERQALHYAWIVLAMGTLAVFGALGLGRFGYTMLLPAMQSGLALTNAQAGLLATANLAGYLAMSAIGGALAARFGARSVIAAGLAAAGIGMLLTGTAHGLGTAALWRGLTGLGGGACNVAVMGLMPGWFASRRRGLAAGIAVSGSSLGLIFTGPLVPYVLARFGPGSWRSCWLVFAVLTLGLAAAAYALLRNKPADKGLRPVAAGEEPAPPSQEPAGAVPWRRIYRSFAVWHLGLVYVAFGFSYIIYMTFFTKHLLADAGYGKTGAGALFMLMGWFSLLCGLLWGTVSDRIGRKQTIAIVYLIQATAFCLFTFTAARAALAVSAILFGLTAWSIPAIMAAACGDILGARLAPATLGFITLFFGLGQAVGPSVAGSIADACGSFSPAFLLAAGVAVMGALGAFTLRQAPAV